MNGEVVESNEIFNQDDFLFDKGRRLKPADEIELLYRQSCRLFVLK